MSRLIKVVVLDMHWAMPWLTTLSWSWMYDIKAVLVQCLSFMMAVASKPCWNRAMAPPARSEWDLTMLGV